MTRGRALAVLVSMAMLAALLLAGLDSATRERIARNESQKLIAMLAAVLPPDYDNEPHLDQAQVSAPAALGSIQALPVYRARRDGQPAGLVMTVIAPDAYVDTITLLVGISAQDKVVGVRAIRHAETPGLGDGIETRRGDWIRAFAGRDVASPRSAWALRRDGGEFDQLSGATITSRAVVNAVRRAVEFYQLNREMLYTQTDGKDS